MKGNNIFCASQAGTAACLSMEEASSSSPSPSTILASSSPAIDRYNPIIRDSTRIAKPVPPCTASHPPVSPKPRKSHHNRKKNKRIPLKGNEDQPKKTDSSTLTKLDDDKIKDSLEVTTDYGNATATAFVSPPGSTRHLLKEKASFNASLGFDLNTNLFLEEALKDEELKTEELCDLKQHSSSHSPHQVVVLRVSLHCRGCEKKLRKHLSRMEGVTSFDIDFAAKKVTVTGNVTPLDVLSSISKVKNAQLWSPAMSSPIPPSVNYVQDKSVFV